MVKLTKEALIELLNNESLELDDKTLQDVHNMIKIDPAHLKLISEFLHKLEFKENISLARDLCILDHGGVIDTLINHTIEEKDLPQQKSFNLIDLCHSKGIVLGADVLHFLLHFKPESSNHVGKGEALMRVLMKGTPTTSGDFGASGKKFEVKFNSSRLRGMIGFKEEASIVSETLDELFIHECDSIKFDARPLIGTDPARWNFVSGRMIKKHYLLSEIVKQSGMDPLYACKIFVTAYRKFFTHMTDKEALNLSYSLSKEFTSNGLKDRLGYSDFIYKMCAYSMKYYANVEDFDGMLVLNDQFDCMYITREFIDTESLEILSEFIHENLKITTPSLTVKAGPQGCVFGIAL